MNFTTSPTGLVIFFGMTRIFENVMGVLLATLFGYLRINTDIFLSRSLLLRRKTMRGRERDECGLNFESYMQNQNHG